MLGSPSINAQSILADTGFLLSLKLTPYFPDALKWFFFTSFNSLIAQLVKTLSAMQTLVQFLGRENPLEKG